MSADLNRGQGSDFIKRKKWSALYAETINHRHWADLSGGLTPDLGEDIYSQCAALLSGEKSLAAISQHSPQDVEAIYTRGYEAYLAHHFSTAVEEFALVTLLDPLDERYHMALASALQQEKRYTEALNFFLYASLLGPDEPGLALRIAECLLALDERLAARVALQSCVELCQVQRDAELKKYAQSLLKELH